MRKAALSLLILLAIPTLASARPPVVVELYTAQGCEPCGEANEFVGSLAERPGVLPLTFSVDYWDYLGWKDTFARPEFAERQKAYVAQFQLNEPYTPQVVVDGAAQVAGVHTDRVERLVREAGKARRNPPDVKFIGPRRVDVGSGRPPKGGAEVWLVRYDPRMREVAVKAGDNRGDTLVHRNVVREIHRLGLWRGRPTAYRIKPAAEEGLKTLVLVQARDGGRIITAYERR